MTQRHQYLWLDLETTGLIAGIGRVLEFAAVLCADAKGDDLRVVSQYEGVIHWPAEELERLRERGAIDDYVYRMHTDNGLWAEVEASDVTLAEAESFLVDLVTELTGDSETRVKLAGNSVGQFDRAWIGVHMPEFYKRLSHQCFDVSTLSMAAESWGPGLDRGEPAHRALPDVLRSIEIARRFRKAVGW
jgi:oligoribonuclease (3'-5' exoribonuclease)